MSFTIAAMPAYNEEYADQVVVVDDGSSDATGESDGAIIAAEIWSDYQEEPMPHSRSSQHSIGSSASNFQFGSGLD